MKNLLIAMVLASSLGSLTVPALAAAPANDSKGMIMHFYDEVMTQNKLDLVDKFIAKNAVDHDPNTDPKKSTIDNFKTMMSAMHTGFPDLKLKVEDVILDGDKVAVRFRMTGSHKGEFMGIKPTGKQIDIEGVDVMRIANGLIVEHWGYMDSMIMMQQLGLMH